jgi:hypothetical protein
MMDLLLKMGAGGPMGKAIARANRYTIGGRAVAQPGF